MRFVRGLLGVGAVAISALVSGSSAAPSVVGAETWMRMTYDCGGGNICRETWCYSGGSEQCSFTFCSEPGCS